MAKRQLPHPPNLDQLKHRAKDLLRGVHRGEPESLAEFVELHPRAVPPAEAKLSDAQLVIARGYGVPSWPRLVLACRMIAAIHRDDPEAVRELIREHPDLLHEQANGRPTSNWGPPMSYAANLGRDRVIQMLADLGAEDVQHAFVRACLQGRVETARWLLGRGAVLDRDIVVGSCETQNADGLKMLLDLGAEISDAHGNRLLPVALLLETYCRNPDGKHRCLELMAEHGIDLPDTPTMALHRGRIDLLEKHLAEDPGLLARRFTHQELYPPELACHEDESLALHGSPLHNTTLLHMCVDFDEMEIAEWLLERGAEVNAKARVDAEGYGGHTALFGCVVSQPYRVGRRKDDSFARLLLDHGADTAVRATLPKRLRFVPDESLHIYRGVTALEFGEQFHNQDWVSPAVMGLLRQRV
ncbi:MAG: ankyrin repeat domain-containing protein [Planctomycetota bacterium]